MYVALWLVYWSYCRPGPQVGAEVFRLGNSEHFAGPRCDQVPVEVAVDIIKDARPTIQLSKTYLSLVERMHPQLVEMFLQQS